MTTTTKKGGPGGVLLHRHNGLRYETIDERHADDVVRFMKKNFFPDEILAIAVDLTQPENFPDAEVFLRFLIAQKQSFVVRNDQTDDKSSIVGAMLMLCNVHRCADDTSEDEDAYMQSKIKSRSMRSILTFLESIEGTGGDLFDKYKVDQVWDFVMICTDSSQRGKGVAKAMLDVATRVAVERGGGVAKCVATCVPSQIAFSRAGFEMITEWFYDEYKNEQGDVVFKRAFPEKSSQFMIKRL